MSTAHETPVRGRGIEDGLAARVHDPLWFLARQWQFGEFLHENAASPAWVEASVESHRLDRWRPSGGAEWLPYDVDATPLQRMVEEHQGGATARLRLEGGLRWRRSLAAAGRLDELDDYLTRCAFPEDPLLGRETALARAAVPDGARLVATLQGQVTDRDRDAELVELAAQWLAWWGERVPRAVPPEEDCWDEHRLEHRFAVSASTLPDVELRADGYAGGRLDWSSVDAFTVAGAAQPSPGEPMTTSRRGVPAPARFGGMPAPRFWEMEDARFDPGSVDAAPIDLGRLMLVGYATVYGNDWFVVPVALPVGTLSRVTELVVHDVFGGATSLTRIADDQDRWNLFGLTLADQSLEPDQERPTSPWFLLSPSLPASLESAPTDRVVLLRDEMANLAWAVESLVADDAGRPRDRFTEWAARDEPAPVESELPLYRVATDVPDHWFPLAPTKAAGTDEEATRLVLVPLDRVVDGEVVSTLPTGTLLGGADTWLHEEEVPRAGVQVERTWQHARWHDGSRHLWQARRRRTGRGEGDSGLRFDVVEDTRTRSE